MSSENIFKKIDTKDWVYLFIISFFLQFIIYYFSFIYGGSVKALGYISFAGTLISIILAVIAIGYTYGESIKQKSSSDQLLLEISGLRDIKEKLAGQVDILENIADLKTAMEDTKNAVNKLDLAKAMKQFVDMVEDDKSGASSEIVEIDKIEELIYSFKGIVDFYILKFIHSIRSEELNSFQEILFNAIDAEFDVDPDRWLDEANHFTAIFYMCLALGIFTETDGLEKIHVSEKVIEAFQNKYKAKDTLPDENYPLGKLVKELIAMPINN